MGSPHPQAGAPRGRILVRWVLGLSLLLNLVPFWWGLPAVRTWAFDEIRTGWVEDPSFWSEKYPPFHRYVLSALFEVLEPFEPLLEPQGVPQWVAERTVYLAAARLLSVLLAVGTVWLVYRAARAAGIERLGASLAALCLALSPTFVFYAKTANLDGPQLFWFAASLFFLLRSMKQRKLRHLVLFGTTAALAIATKDQAYGLYLLCPLLLIASFANAHQGTPRRFLRATFAPRLWLGGAVAAGVFLLVHRIPWDAAEFRDHFAMITGDETEKFRVFPNSPRGLVDMTILAVRHLAFVLSAPILLATLFGSWRAWRDGRKRLNGVWLLPLGYYLGFVCLIGYHYDRFLLPVGLVMALFAGYGLAALWNLGRPSAAARVAVSAALLWALARAVSIDFELLDDPRYAVEEWLSAQPERAKSVGVGRDTMLPRGIGTADWSTLERHRCAFLLSSDARYLVVNRGDAWGAEELSLLAALDAEDLPFRLAYRTPERARPRLLRFSGIQTNLDKIDHSIDVFMRTDDECYDTATLPGHLERLQSGNDRTLRNRLAGAIGRFPANNRKPYAEHTVAVGLEFDGWTRGTQPAAVLISNSSSVAQQPRLKLGCEAPLTQRPVTAWLDDGIERHPALFEQTRQIAVDLAPLEPGDQRLAILWSDSSWTPGGDDTRTLGVSLLQVELLPVKTLPVKEQP